jgi:hypothetical protein
MGEQQSARAVFIPLARFMSSGAVSGRDSGRVEVRKSMIRMMAQARFITDWLPFACREDHGPRAVLVTSKAFSELNKSTSMSAVDSAN